MGVVLLNDINFIENVHMAVQRTKQNDRSDIKRKIWNLLRI